MEAQAGDEDLEVSLAAAGTLELRAEDASTGQSLAAEFLLGKGPRRRYAGGYQEASVTRKRLQLEPGLHDVIATRTAEGSVGVLRGVEVSAGASAGESVVPLSPGGWLQIRVEGAAHTASFEIRVDGLSFVKLGIQPGASLKALIPPGRVVVFPLLGGSPGPEQQGVWLEAGAAQELIFRWEY